MDNKIYSEHGYLNKQKYHSNLYDWIESLQTNTRIFTFELKRGKYELILNNHSGTNRHICALINKNETS